VRRHSAERAHHDVFISYRHVEPDASWVTQRFVPALRAAGMTVYLDHGDFRLGPPVSSNMEDGVEASRFTLAVWTPNYLTSRFTAAEFDMAYGLGVAESRSRLVVVERGHLPPPDVAVPRVDMTDDACFDAGVAEIRRIVDARDDGRVAQ
jgi:hypothetical protein